MTRLLHPLILFIAWNAFAEVEFPLGEERIEPLKYPKGMLAFDYGLWRNARFLGKSGIKDRLEATYTITLSSEVTLSDNLAMGLSFANSIPHSVKLSPTVSRFSVYIKPFISLGSQVSFFTRVGIGISTSLIFPISNYLNIHGEKETKD